MDGLDDPRMRSATANVALQGLNNLRRCGTGICREKADAAHDHARSAISALKRPFIQEGLLNGMQSPVLFEAFNSCNGFCRGCAHRSLTRSARRPTDQDRARAALPFATSVLGARQAEFVAECGEKRCFRIALHRVALTVDFKLDRLRHLHSSGLRNRFACVAVSAILPPQRLRTEPNKWEHLVF